MFMFSELLSFLAEGVSVDLLIFWGARLCFFAEGIFAHVF